jgi:isopentenyl-diphosphate delta-isomerase
VKDQHSPLVTIEPPLLCKGPKSLYLRQLSMSELVVSTEAAWDQALTLSILMKDDSSLNIAVSSWQPKSVGLWVGRITQDAVNLANVTDLLARLRKSQHIAICAEQDVEASDRLSGFEQLEFVPVAAPELNWSDINTQQGFLGRSFDAPMLITGMTGGVEQGAMINRRLARAAARQGIPMGVGSQRLAIDNPQLAKIFTVKDSAPDLFLIANIGAAQLATSYGIDECRRAIEMIDADALAIHLNIIQELVQVEGDRCFAGLLQRIATICSELSVPVIIKEVGNGVDPSTAMALIEAGVAAIDVGGRGGTSWAYIEGLRSQSALVKSAANTFRNWGIPTAHALSAIRNIDPRFPLIATGGIRNGLMVAKAVALGATMVGIGLPLLRASLQSDDAVSEVLDTYLHELKVTMMATASTTLDQLPRRLSLGSPLHAELVKRVVAAKETTC